MQMDDEANAVQMEESEMVMPAMSTEDPRTYDPTQGAGTDAWQAAVRRQMEFNAQQRRN